MMVDPFDIKWTESDPIGRDAVMLKSIIDARESAGKHDSDIERLSPDEVREVISDPDRIDYSAKSQTRDVYYKVDSTKEHPFSRAVVDFRNERGIVISWSRYKKTVSSFGVKWRKGDENV